jgi:hypothetical protein
MRLSAPPGEGLGLVLWFQILGMVGVGVGGEGVLAPEAALVLELEFPLNLDLGLAPGIEPNLYSSIPWWKHAAGHALPAT